MSHERHSCSTFSNGRGEFLAGIVQEPIAGDIHDTAVVLLSPGVKGRVAPHRLYRKLATEFTRRGFRVLRYDFTGLGDSEGTLDYAQLNELYRDVQSGLFVDDTRAALAWLEATYGHRQFIVGGLCGGAITALLSLADDPRMVGWLAVGVPAQLDATEGAVAHVTAGQLDRLRQGYVRKLLDVKSWLRLLSGRTDFRMLWRSLVGKSLAQPTKDAPSDAPDGNANPKFAPALLRLFERRCPALLLFSGTDRLQWEFEEKFVARHRDALAASTTTTVHVIPDANHVLTFPEWQAEAVTWMHGWIDRHFSLTSARP